MALHFILDGYNIIKSGSSALFEGRTLEEQRNRLIGLLQECRPQGSARNSVTIVFDGKAEHPYWEDSYSAYHVGEIEILFSEGVKADDIIARIVNEAASAAETVVVTNDKGIRRRLGGTGARCMPVEEFVGKMRHPGTGRRTERPACEDGDMSSINEEFRKKWLK